MEKSLEHLKHIERISRQTRHHRTHLNQIYDQKLHQELDHLTNEYEQTFKRTKIHQKLEQQRKEILGITVQQIVNERQGHSLSRNITQSEILSKHNENRPLSSTKLPPTTKISCRLFSHNCQLYPCQPVYHYTSFMKKEHDQTLKERNPSRKNSNLNSNRSHLQNLFLNIQEKKYQPNRRQLAVTINNQNHLVHRYVSMERTMTYLNEQSRLLHERLTDKKTFGYIKERQYELRQAIQRHLKISAKFCA